ncbi:MAG: 3-oxoacyl-[acyl-carrier-protein] synthase II [Saprospiraceae bacterium]|jgi:3-oxoacyl-[acyl-carrier-protein] synthase II
MQNPISITSIASISSLGSNMDAIWKNYCNPNHNFVINNFEKSKALVAPLSSFETAEIELLKKSNNKYKNLDKSVLMAIYASRKAVKTANWKDGDYGINIGSSRGATSLFEKYHKEFLENNRTNTLASPTTTLGNISSWIAHDLQSQGPTISHSITCSTALHALINGVAWINAGMSDKFLVGGSEAPLTEFTIAQMKAMKIYASDMENDFPCRTLDFQKKMNTMILGEGSSVICLEKGIVDNSLAIIEGVGFATEILEHNISISSDAQCFQKSMKMALKNTDVSEVDVIVMHAPGTLKGDSSEYKAIQEVFGNSIPSLTSNKWKIGHTFGASGALSIELAILMMLHQKFIDIPFLENQKQPKQIKKVLVNAVGFGGNAVSILLSNQN